MTTKPTYEELNQRVGELEKSLAQCAEEKEKLVVYNILCKI